jgi:predicted nucleic-acid-binding Zn-ribbon protein
MPAHTWSVPASESIASLKHWELSEHLRLARLNPERYASVSSLLEAELVARSPTTNYKCMKCQHAGYELQKIRAARSLLSSVFGVDSAQYTAVVCSRCGFTEFYNGTVPAGEQALDFIFGR